MTTIYEQHYQRLADETVSFLENFKYDKSTIQLPKLAPINTEQDLFHAKSKLISITEYYIGKRIEEAKHAEAMFKETKFVDTKLGEFKLEDINPENTEHDHTIPEALITLINEFDQIEAEHTASVESALLRILSALKTQFPHLPIFSEMLDVLNFMNDNTDFTPNMTTFEELEAALNDIADIAANRKNELTEISEPENTDYQHLNELMADFGILFNFKSDSEDKNTGSNETNSESSEYVNFLDESFDFGSYSKNKNTGRKDTYSESSEYMDNLDEFLDFGSCSENYDTEKSENMNPMNIFGNFKAIYRGFVVSYINRLTGDENVANTLPAYDRKAYGHDKAMEYIDRLNSQVFADLGNQGGFDLAEINADLISYENSAKTYAIEDYLKDSKIFIELLYNKYPTNSGFTSALDLVDYALNKNDRQGMTFGEVSELLTEISDNITFAKKQLTEDDDIDRVNSYISLIEMNNDIIRKDQDVVPSIYHAAMRDKKSNHTPNFFDVPLDSTLTVSRNGAGPNMNFHAEAHEPRGIPDSEWQRMVKEAARDIGLSYQTKTASNNLIFTDPSNGRVIVSGDADEFNVTGPLADTLRLVQKIADRAEYTLTITSNGDPKQDLIAFEKLTTLGFKVEIASETVAAIKRLGDDASKKVETVETKQAELFSDSDSLSLG